MPDEIYGVMAVKNGQKQTIMNLSNARQKSYADLQNMTDAQKKGVIVCPDYPKEEFLVTADEVSYGSGTVEDALDAAMPKFIGNKIYDFAASGNESWTATQDCWISGTVKYTTSQGNYDTSVQIDGKYVGTCYVQNNTAMSSVCAPCKKGQTVTTGRNASSDSYSLLKAYAMI